MEMRSRCVGALWFWTPSFLFSFLFFGFFLSRIGENTLQSGLGKLIELTLFNNE